MIGNYGYIDNARPPGKQGMVWGFRLAVTNPARATAITNKIDRYFANSDTPTLAMPARIAAENMAHSSIRVQPEEPNSKGYDGAKAGFV